MKTKNVEFPVTIEGKVEVKAEKWTDPGPNEPTGAGSPVPSKNITVVYSDGGVTIEDLHDPLLNIVEAHGPGWREVTKIDYILHEDGSVRVDLIHEGESTFAEDIEDVCEAIEDTNVLYDVKSKAKRILSKLKE